jgi:hypothetical protein
MRILFDNGVPRGIAKELQHHDVREARAEGWDRLRNGELLDAAEALGFEVFLTTDRNIVYQQELTNRKIAIVVLGKARWRLIKLAMRAIVAAIEAATPGSYIEVHIPDQRRR